MIDLQDKVVKPLGVGVRKDKKSKIASIVNVNVENTAVTGAFHAMGCYSTLFQGNIKVFEENFSKKVEGSKSVL